MTQKEIDKARVQIALALSVILREHDRLNKAQGELQKVLQHLDLQQELLLQQARKIVIERAMRDKH